MQTLQLKHILGRKILFYILVCSSILTIFATLIQLYSDYLYDVSELEQRFLVVETSYLDSLSLNLWTLNIDAVNEQLSGINNLPNVHYVELTTPQGDVYQSGEKTSADIRFKTFDVIHDSNPIGQLLVEVNYADIYQKLIKKAGVILFTQFIKTLLAAFCILTIIYWLVTRHVYQIVSYGKQLSLNNLESKLSLEGKRSQHDELDMLVDSLNSARYTLISELNLRKEAESKLVNLNENLEALIDERTVELEQTIETLHHAQNELVQSQKMASLGSLVAGISHEINTPIGIGVTSATSIEEEVSLFLSKYKNGTMKKSDLESFIQHIKEASDILTKNLHRASELISSFKLISVDQTGGKHRTIKIHDYIDEIITSMRPKLKKTSIEVINKTQHDLPIFTDPGALYQILSNFIDNSLIHGFNSDSTGAISISSEVEGQYLKLIYEDTGKGIEKSIKARIFDPFFTTRLGKGGSGLGLSVVYNLITSTLKGKVEVYSDQNSGTRFEILLPINKEEVKSV